RSPAKACALSDDDECSFLEPDDETLQEMARCGIARLEVPQMPRPEAGMDAFPASWREAAGVTEEEHDKLERAAESFAKQHRQQWAELAASAGIDRSWAETSVPVVVSTRIFAEFDEDQYASAVENVARERAGKEPSGEDVPGPLDAAVRLRLGAGDAYEAAIADAVGEARAAELRAAGDGWPGTHGTVGNRCEVEPEPPRARDFVPRNAAEAEACIDAPKAQHCAFLDPTELERERMADCGVVRFDAPGFLGARFSEPTFDFDDGWASSVDLSPAEAAALAEVGDAFRDSLYGDLTKLALEAGKSQAWADQTPFIGMMVAIAESSGATQEDTEAVLRRLAEERAGRAEPPSALASRSIDERFLRRVIELGDAFERAVAKRLGAERARALRVADDGWPGLRLQTQNYCDGGKPQML
ncbi:MAG: hypothetical protein AAF721_23870, partial [Myxococcota bacterium]